MRENPLWGGKIQGGNNKKNKRLEGKREFNKDGQKFERGIY